MLLQQVVVGSTAGVFVSLKLEQVSYCFQFSRCKLNLFRRGVWGFCGAAARGPVGLFCLCAAGPGRGAGPRCVGKHSRAARPSAAPAGRAVSTPKASSHTSQFYSLFSSV